MHKSVKKEINKLQKILNNYSNFSAKNVEGVLLKYVSCPEDIIREADHAPALIINIDHRYVDREEIPEQFIDIYVVSGHEVRKISGTFGVTPKTCSGVNFHDFGIWSTESVFDD